MKKNFGIILAIALGLSALLLTIGTLAGWVQANPFTQEERAGAPTFVSYQGQIWDGKIPYEGTGYFKFAIYDSSIKQTWSNDGNDPPTTAIPLDVVNGLFSVNLGDTKIDMEPLGAKVFDDPETFLQVWFSPNGTSWSTLPEQRIAAVPYAFQADSAALFDGLPTSWFQERVDGTCIPGKGIIGVNQDGSVTCSPLYQYQVTGSCPEGKSVKTINPDGSVICGPETSLLTVDKTGDLTGPIDSSIAIGMDGFALISYYDTTNTNLKVAHCDDIACTNATISTIAGDKVDVGSQTDIAIGSDGLGVISYTDNGSGALKFAHCVDFACINAEIVTIDSAGSYSSIAIGTDGLPLISYFYSPTLDLKVAHCNDIKCISVTLASLDTTNNTGQGTSLAIGGDGLGLISYYYFTGGDLKVAHCNDISCAHATLEVIDPNYSNGGPTSIAIGTDGFGLISYGGGLSNLKVAHCKNSVCSSSSLTTIDTTSTGDTSSIVIGMDGFGLISYWDILNYDIKVAHCNNLACSTAYTYTLDGPDQIGGGGSLAIGMDGLGVISYWNITHSGLKVAHCSNRFCNPDW